MVIGIDARSAEGNPAGIGVYFYNLIENLILLEKDVFVVYTRNGKLFPNVNSAFLIQKEIHLPLVLWHLRIILDSWFLEKLDRFYTNSYFHVLLMPPRKCVLFLADLTHVLMPKFHTLKVVCLAKLINLAVVLCRSIITISAASKADIVNCYKVNPDKVHAIHLAARKEFIETSDLSKLISVKNKFNLPDEFLFFAGSNEPRKNLKTIILAINHLKNQLDQKLVIAGGSGWRNSDIYQLISTLQLNDKIIFLGYVTLDDLIAIYNLSTVFLYPSLYEGFGLPILEAMSCGTPVITSNNSSMSEVAGGAAVLVSPLDVRELSASIMELLNNSAKREQLRAAGLLRAKDFNWFQTASLSRSVLIS